MTDRARAARGWPREISDMPASDGTPVGDVDAGSRADLEAELVACKDALEKMTADRDRLAEKAASLRHAFETTAIDRDIRKQNAIDWKQAVVAFLGSDDFKRAPAITAPRRDPLPRPLGPGLPNVFCVGVQKSATSFLYSIIRNHPRIAVYPKDSSILGRLHETGSLSEYTEMAIGLDSTRPAIAQFEAGFLGYSMAGAETIKRYLCKNPKIIICVRNPIDRLISHYKMLIRTIRANGTSEQNGVFIEDHDFDNALALERYRSARNPREYFVFYCYKQRSLYSEKIEFYIKTFGRENVHVVIMDDIMEKTSETIAGVFDFISLFDEDAFKLSLKSHDKYRINSQTPTEIEIIFHLADGRRLHDPAGMEDIGGGDVARLEIRSNIPAQLDIRRDDPRPDLLIAAIHLKRRLSHEPSREEKARLFNTYFRDDVARLETLLGRDLSVWYRDYDDRT